MLVQLQGQVWEVTLSIPLPPSAPFLPFVADQNKIRGTFLQILQLSKSSGVQT